jgi:hypothetical protein
MHVAGDDPPWAVGFCKLGKAQVKVYQPMTGSMFDILPESRFPAPVVATPVARFKLPGIVAVDETLAPPAIGELIEIPDKDRIQL